MIIDPAKDRYLSLIKEKPNLIQNVPLNKLPPIWALLILH